jgi:CRISPR-associated protein Csx17
MTDTKDELIAPIEAWIEAVDAADILKAPEDFLVGYGSVHRAIAELVETGDPGNAPRLLTALAACEFVMAERPDFTTRTGLPPLQPLPAGWLALMDDGSTEFRLAASLSALRPVGLGGDDTRVRPFRTHLEPIDYRFDRQETGLGQTSLSWDFNAQQEVVWDKERAVDGLNAIFARRLKMWAASAFEFGQSAVNARFDDIARFIRGETDEAKLSRLCFELSLVDAWRLPQDLLAPKDAGHADVDPAFALAHLCYSGQGYAGRDLPLNRDIHLLANRGDLDTALEFGGAHLRKHGFETGASEFESDIDSRRVAAALLFPISDDQRDVLAEAIEAK